MRQPPAARSAVGKSADFVFRRELSSFQFRIQGLAAPRDFERSRAAGRDVDVDAKRCQQGLRTEGARFVVSPQAVFDFQCHLVCPSGVERVN